MLLAIVAQYFLERYIVSQCLQEISTATTLSGTYLDFISVDHMCRFTRFSLFCLAILDVSSAISFHFTTSFWRFQICCVTTMYCQRQHRQRSSSWRWQSHRIQFKLVSHLRREHTSSLPHKYPMHVDNALKIQMLVSDQVKELFSERLKLRIGCGIDIKWKHSISDWSKWKWVLSHSYNKVWVGSLIRLWPSAFCSKRITPSICCVCREEPMLAHTNQMLLSYNTDCRLWLVTYTVFPQILTTNT